MTTRYKVDEQSREQLQEWMKITGPKFQVALPEGEIYFRGPDGLENNVCMTASVTLNARAALDGTPLPGRDLYMTFTCFDKQGNKVELYQEALIGSPAEVEKFIQEGVTAVARADNVFVARLPPTNHILFGTFLRYGIPEINVFTFLKNSLVDEETGFYLRAVEESEDNNVPN